MQSFKNTMCSMYAGVLMSFGIAIITGCKYSRSLLNDMIIYGINIAKYGSIIIMRICDAYPSTELQDHTIYFFDSHIKFITKLFIIEPQIMYGLFGFGIFISGLYDLMYIVSGQPSQKQCCHVLHNQEEVDE